MVKKLREIATGKSTREETSKQTPDKTAKNSAVQEPISPTGVASVAASGRWEDEVDYEEASFGDEVQTRIRRRSH